MSVDQGLTYGDVFQAQEQQMSRYNFEQADTEFLLQQFDHAEAACQALLALEVPLPLPAYERVLEASHAFNLLDARHAVSVMQRQQYILRIRTCARAVAQAYLQQRSSLDFPLLKMGEKANVN